MLYEIKVSVYPYKTLNTEFNDSRKIIYSRKSEVSVEGISVCNAIENLAEHGIHTLSAMFLYH